MTLLTRIRIAAALAACAPLALMTAAPATAQALSPAVGNALKQAQKLAAAGNISAATAQVNTARAAASTPAERRKVAEMSAYVNTRAGRYGAAAQELESVGAPASQLAPLYYRAGNYDKAIALGRRMGNQEGQTIVAQSYIRTGKYGDAAKVYDGLIKSYGPKQQWLENLAGAQYKMGDKKAYLATTERLIRVDPSPARWKALLLDLKGENMPREAKLGLYHLMRQTGNISRPEDYSEFAKLAIVSNQPGVARNVLGEAQTANAVSASDPLTGKLIAESSKRAAAAEAGVGKLPATAAGQLTAGHTWFGKGDYARAQAAYSAAIKAGADKNQASLMLGIAQLRGGNSAAAQSTFKSVPAGTAYGDVAALWALYAATAKG